MSFKAFAAAVELDVFTRFSGERLMSVDEFAAELQVEHRPADILLAALASLDLLEKKGDAYKNSALAEEFLVTGREHYFGGYVRYYDRKLYPGWQRAVEAIATNRPVLWDPDKQDSVFDPKDDVVMGMFWEAMHSLAGFTANALSDVHDFGAYRRLLDVGGGSAGFPIALCSRIPGLSATVYELPHVCPIALAKIEAAGLAGTIDTLAGDFAKDVDLPSGYDVILLSQILHCLDEQTGRDLLEKCWRALPQGGAVLICEHLLNPERTGPAPAALMGMNMLIGQVGGKNYAETEYMSWLADIGFSDIDVVRFDAAGANGAVIARKTSTGAGSVSG
jgi:hypothetical protein